MQTFERTAWCSLIQIIAFKGDPIGRKVFSGHFTQALTISIIMMRIINTRYSLKKNQSAKQFGTVLVSSSLHICICISFDCFQMKEL
jgi:hypothetical protein